MGKNTMIKRSICIHQFMLRRWEQCHSQSHPSFCGNVGLIFTKGDLKESVKRLQKTRFEPLHVKIGKIIFCPHF